VLDAAVVGMPDEHWGERPKAFVVPRPGHQPSEEELIEHVRDQIAHYKAPGAVEFLDELPKTSTGKLQKYELREREWARHQTHIKG
jgi:fatty-acyl-CoA synthase